MDNKYNNSKVVELTTKDFSGTTLINPQFKNKYSMVKVYAPWCPHCTSMVEDMKFLAENLEKQDIKFGAINGDNPLNKELTSKLGVQWFPYLYMVNEKGVLEHIDISDRNVENILNTICKKTNEYSSNKKGRCCKKVGSKIVC
jgi:thiol-disulfide isomerase/thioredoxin